MAKTAMLLFISFMLSSVSAYVLAPAVFATDELRYVGSETCGECHPDQFESFTKNSKKSKSYTSVKRMAAKLTPQELKECYGCHTTG